MSTPYGGNDPSASYPGGQPAGGAPQQPSQDTYGSQGGAPSAPAYPGAPTGAEGTGYPGAGGGQGGAGGYGGYGGAPGVPGGPQKPNNGRKVIIGCVIAAVVLLLLAGAALAAYFLLHKDKASTESEPVSSSSASEKPTGDKSSSSDSPSASDSDSPSASDTSSGTGSVDLKTGETGEQATVETDTQNYTPTNGAFVYVDVTLTNNTDHAIAFTPDSFTIIDTTGAEHEVTVGTSDADSSELAPGESAEARLYIDVPSGTQADTVHYDDASTGTTGG